MKQLPTIRHLVERVLQFLDGLERGVPGGTRAVLQHLADSPVGWGPHTIGASCLMGTRTGPEYLVDLTISEDQPHAQDNDPFGYVALLLAVEVEWSPARFDRRYDFCKLADIRARRKLFVGACSGAAWSKVGDEVEAMQRFIDGHEMVAAGEEFGVVLCNYGDDDDRGWVLRKGGEAPEVVSLR